MLKYKLAAKVTKMHGQYDLQKDKDMGGGGGGRGTFLFTWSKIKGGGVIGNFGDGTFF